MSKLEQILQKLPQTQCQLCQHKGCKPYAEALISGQDTIDKCHPGGLKTLHALGAILEQDTSVYEQNVAQRETKNSVVFIDESTCIGCTKCIQACPVDAIMGTAKANHVVITSECTGCNLCIPACPVDCIHELEIEGNQTPSEYRRKRYEARILRLSDISSKKQAKHISNKEKIRKKLDSIKAENAEKKS